MIFIDAQNAGISGDMLIAALLDMGASVENVERALEPIAHIIGKYRLETKKVKRGIFGATSYRFNFDYNVSKP
jgi:uncharacterized protein (DUF111 family)